MSVGYIDTGAELQGEERRSGSHGCSLLAAVAAKPASKPAELRLSVTASSPVPPEDPKHTTVRLRAAQSSRETRKKKPRKLDRGLM